MTGHVPWPHGSLSDECEPFQRATGDAVNEKRPNDIRSRYATNHWPRRTVPCVDNADARTTALGRPSDTSRITVTASSAECPYRVIGAVVTAAEASVVDCRARSREGTSNLTVTMISSSANTRRHGAAGM